MVDSAEEQPEPKEGVGLLEGEYLRTIVPVMRELGVIEFEGVKLGPPPRVPDLAAQVFPEPTAEDIEAKRKALAERKRALFYKAAS